MDKSLNGDRFGFWVLFIFTPKNSFGHDADCSLASRASRKVRCSLGRPWSLMTRTGHWVNYLTIVMEMRFRPRKPVTETFLFIHNCLLITADLRLVDDHGYDALRYVTVMVVERWRLPMTSLIRVSDVETSFLYHSCKHWSLLLFMTNSFCWTWLICRR